jgi:uncharacterized membrane protein
MKSNWLLPILVGLITAGTAWHSTLLATPYVLMSAALDKIATGRINTFVFTQPSTADNQPIVRPSPDLSYSTCVFDLANGSVLLDIEPVPDHYWSISIFDARTDVAAVRSDRDTGGKSARLALIRKGMAVPKGYEPVELRYDKGLALIRILMTDAADYPAIDAIRRTSRCRVAKTK